jgi:membrane-associated protease RseP (regulator of RpoE activity)
MESLSSAVRKRLASWDAAVKIVSMKKTIPLFLSVLALGCSLAMANEKPIHQRGWIGGQYKVVKVFPAGFSNAPKAAILITTLNTNTPASLAGLEAGDLILELNHQPATTLRSLRRTIDNTEPGTLLPVKLWHDGQIVERKIRVGRETYKNVGVFMVGLPGFFQAPKLWPFTVGHAGFSLGFAGFKPEPVSDRKELSSVEETYFKNCNPKNYQPTDAGWKVWLVIMQAETHKRIRSQEIVPSTTGTLPNTKDGQMVGIR